MEPQEIIATAESGSFPENWHVWTLRRGLVFREVAWQTFISVFGFILLGYGLYATIPDNFTQGPWKIGLTICLLLLFAVMAFGGLALMAGDVNRLRLAGRYLLVMTPDDFLKRTPGAVVHVPMEHVTDLRLIGVKSRGQEDMERPGGVMHTVRSIGLASTGAFLGNWLIRTPRVQPKLTFVDDRTGKVVVVGQDHAFEDLGALEYILRIYVGDKERELRAARSRR
ncbi:MAG TPA: hypothetical protein VH349_10170 [Ktedonobacterales bacterium]|jgi:hypothetical protein